MTKRARGDQEGVETTSAVNRERRTLEETARELVELSTKAQGLPFYVEDEATLLKIARLMKAPRKSEKD